MAYLQDPARYVYFFLALSKSTSSQAPSFWGGLSCSQAACSGEETERNFTPSSTMPHSSKLQVVVYSIMERKRHLFMARCEVFTLEEGPRHTSPWPPPASSLLRNAQNNFNSEFWTSFPQTILRSKAQKTPWKRDFLTPTWVFLSSRVHFMVEAAAGEYQAL